MSHSYHVLSRVNIPMVGISTSTSVDSLIQAHLVKSMTVWADWIVKDELIREHVHNHYNVVYCLDDRNQVVHHNRDMGYKVFQVAPGNF